MCQPKRHHILPVSFQKLFSSDGKKKVWCSIRGKVFPANSLNVAVVGRHYDFIDEGEKQTWLERALSSREDVAVPLLKKLIEKRTLKGFSKCERATITDFLKLCMMRYFEFTDPLDPNTDDLALESLRAVIRNHFEEIGFQPSPDVLSKKFLLEAHESAKKQAILDPVPKTSDQLAIMHMSVIVTRDSAAFISGDYVAAFFHGNFGNTAIMPICPTLAVRWSEKRSSPVQTVDSKRVQRVNWQIFTMSNYAIASVPDELNRMNTEQ